MLMMSGGKLDYDGFERYPEYLSPFQAGERKILHSVDVTCIYDEIHTLHS